MPLVPSIINPTGSIVLDALCLARWPVVQGTIVCMSYIIVHLVQTAISKKVLFSFSVKEKGIDLIIDETIDNKTERANKIRIKCEVEDVYPEPELSIKLDGK